MLLSLLVIMTGSAMLLFSYIAQVKQAEVPECACDPAQLDQTPDCEPGTDPGYTAQVNNTPESEPAGSPEVSTSKSNTFYGPRWNYEDESTWPGETCKAGGKRQSPIDIRSGDVVKDFNKRFIKYGDLKFIGYKKVLVSGINNGHTIQFSSEGEEAIHPVLTGGPLKYKYRLEQLHFHWISEHAINGVKYPMEIHFVHVRNDIDVPEALNKKDGLAIVSVFCNVQAELDDYQQEASDEVMQHIPKLLEPGNRISGIIIDMTKFLSPNRESYYTYAGSLTSPECNEAVIWIIFDTPIYISDAQYRLFGKVGVGRHNFRALQKLSHHIVFQPPANRINPPQIVKFFDDVVKVVAEFFRNVTSFMSKGLQS